MRERPLSITIIGWANIVAFPLMIVFILALPNLPAISEPDVQPSKTLLGFNLLVATLGLAFAIGLLKGLKPARPWYVGLRTLGVAGPLLLDPTFDIRTLLLPLLCIAVEVWFLYRPRASEFFDAEGEPPAITHQATSAFYFVMTASFLAAGIGMCGYS